MERKPNNVNKCWLTYRDAVIASGIAEKTAKWYDRRTGSHPNYVRGRETVIL
jgi:hypothetical protein